MKLNIYSICEDCGTQVYGFEKPVECEECQYTEFIEFYLKDRVDKKLDTVLQALKLADQESCSELCYPYEHLSSCEIRKEIIQELESEE